MKDSLNFGRSVRLHIIDQHPWRKIGTPGVSLWLAGDDRGLLELSGLLKRGKKQSLQNFTSLLKRMHGHFAFILETTEMVIATVDKARSIPVFYSSSNGLAVANNARKLARMEKHYNADRVSALEMRMAGYVLAGRTMAHGVQQLQPGEYLFFDKDSGYLSLDRYFFYLPTNDLPDNTETLCQMLDQTMEEVFEDVVRVADRRPIWIPLSGGLDSRLILCKLHQMGYSNLHTYSYGLPGNHEARIARTVSERLGVSWEFTPLTAKLCRGFFKSPARHAYWDMADGLASLPVLQDVAVLKDRRLAGKIPSSALFINGQSGDYITGGHVPSALLASGAKTEDALKAITDKHFSLWLDSKTPNNLERILEEIRLHLRRCTDINGSEVPLEAFYESWEWQERQSKYVVNNVRMYEFAGLDWKMPLWDGRLMDFFARVPVRQKIGQRLFKEWLARWDYKDLFRHFHPTVWRWPGHTMAVLPLAWLIGKFAGNDTKEKFYGYAKYIGHYGYAYGIYSWPYYKRRSLLARSPISLFAETWLTENFSEDDQTVLLDKIIR